MSENRFTVEVVTHDQDQKELAEYVQRLHDQIIEDLGPTTTVSAHVALLFVGNEPPPDLQ